MTPSLQKKVMGLKFIKSLPTHLESTSVVLVYGLDMLFTRRTPSKTFDVLSESFNYSALIMTIVGLVVGIQATKRMVTILNAIVVLY